jgi:hypothetical protein
MLVRLVGNGLGKTLEKSGFGLFEEVFWHSLRRTEENHEINLLGWLMLGRDTDPASQERKSERA